MDVSMKARKAGILSDHVGSVACELRNLLHHVSGAEELKLREIIAEYDKVSKEMYKFIVQLKGMIR